MAANRAVFGADAAFAAGLVVLVVATILALAYSAKERPNYELSNLTKSRSEKISLEIANDSFSQMRGLMFRDRIVPMLFIFGSSGIFPIHSHFVKAEFDAVYVGKEGVVNEVYRKIPPDTPLVQPKKNSSYLLELPVDLTDRLAIEEGDAVGWKRLDGK